MTESFSKTAESFSHQPPASESTTRASAMPGSSAELPGTLRGSNELPAGSAKEQQMREVAGRIGGALGNAVRHARGFSGRIRGGLELVQRHVADKAAHLPQESSSAAAQLKETAGAAQEAAAGWRQAAQRKFLEAREQAQGLKGEYPLQIIVGLALASFVIGFGIRIWRSSRG